MHDYRNSIMLQVAEKRFSTMATDLVVAIIERDVRGDWLCAWSYPSIDNGSEATLLSRAALQPPSVSAGGSAFFYSKTKGQWQYYLARGASSGGVASVTMVIISPTFHPEKWRSLLEVLVEQYLESMSPTPVLAAFLRVFTTQSIGSWKGEA